MLVLGKFQPSYVYGIYFPPVVIFTVICPSQDSIYYAEKNHTKDQFW